MKSFPRYERKDPALLGDAAKKLHKVFALPAGRSAKALWHAGLHVILNLGVGIADELRVALYDMPLTFRQIGTASFSQRQHGVLIKALEGQRAPKLKYDDSLLLTPEVAAAQLQTRLLHPEEIRAHTKLALEFEAYIKQKTGKFYYEMTAGEVARMVVAEFDLSAEVTKIRDRYLSPRNARVDEISALALEDSSWARRQQHMPLPNSRWFGPQKRYFG